MATKTKTKAATAYQRVASSAEAICNADPATIATMSPGDVVRQGDLYLVALDVAPARAGEYDGRQLAPGATQGSRHVVVGDCELFTPDEADVAGILSRLVPATKGQRHFFGPVILARGPVTVEHPEHGHRTVPAGIYLVTQQRTWAQEIRRAMD